MTTLQKKTTISLCGVIALSSFLLFFNLGTRSFRNPDEGRYAEIAKEMVDTDQWITPKLYGIDYLRKPALFYWLVAASFKLFGFSEMAARLVPAFFALLGIIMTFWFARKAFDVGTAFYACLILCTNILFIQVGRYLVIDMVFSFFVFSALYFFYLGLQQLQKKRSYAYLFYACCGLSFLAKGILGLVLIAMPCVFYLLWKKKNIFHTLWEHYFIEGFFIFNLLVLPWFVSISLKKPQFFSLFFIRENFSRFTSTNFEHQEAWYFYILVLALCFVPWILFVKPIKSVFRKPSQLATHKDAQIFCIITSVSVLVFLSLSKSKLMTYIVPILPFLAILMAKGWNEWLRSTVGTETKWKDCWTLTPVVLLFFLGALCLISLSIFSNEISRIAGQGFEPKSLLALKGMAFSMAFGAFIAGIVFIRKNKEYLFVWLIVTMAFFLTAFSYAMTDFNSNYTTKPFAMKLKPLLGATDEVYVYGAPGHFYDFRFYLNHPVKVVGMEGEFEFSRTDKDAEKSSVTENQFQEMLKRRKRFYCLIKKSDYHSLSENSRAVLSILKEDRRKILFKS